MASLFFFQADAQNQKIRDSLIFTLNNQESISDSLKYTLMIGVSYNSVSADEGIEYALKARDIAIKTNIGKWLAPCYLLLGDGYKSKGDYIAAVDTYIEAAKIYEKHHHLIGVSTAYDRLGSIYVSQGNFNNAVLYFRQSIDIFRMEQDSIRLASSLLNIGELYRLEEKNDSALIFMGESKEVFRLINYPLGSAYNIGNIGLIYAEQGKTTHAEKNILEAIAILEDAGDLASISEYQIALANIYAKLHLSDQALKYATLSLNIGLEANLQENIRDASLTLSDLYNSTGQNTLAYKYLKLYITYRDSINSEETTQKIADLRTEYEVAKKQQEIDVKQIEVDLLNAEASTNQFLLWGSIIIVVLLLFLTYALFKMSRIKDRAIRIVKQRRRIIAGQRNKLEDLNHTKDKFFSIISHDIRGPISNFQGVAQLIQLLVESDDIKGLLKLGKMLDKSSREVSGLLDNLLEWAMSQQGQIPYHPEPISLDEVCNSNLSIMRNSATAKKITLSPDIMEYISVFADKNSVSTIIRNLLNNAIKFTPEGGQVNLSLTYDEHFVAIEVSDNGVGIAPESLKTLFSFQGKKSSWGTSGEKGTGLGLTLVHEFAEMNKGKIEVTSIVGEGTTFKVYLPLKE